MSYLEPDAMANGRPAQMARYFGATLGTAGAVAIVATFNWDDWAVYIGAANALADYAQAADQIARHGSKLSEEDARYFFPEVHLDLPYRD